MLVCFGEALTAEAGLVSLEYSGAMLGLGSAGCGSVAWVVWIEGACADKAACAMLTPGVVSESVTEFDGPTTGAGEAGADPNSMTSGAGRTGMDAAM
jgi:hypothetical protein